MTEESPDERAGPRGEGASDDGPDDSAPENRSALSRALRDVAPYLDLGWRLAGTTAGPPVLGFVADLWLQTTPWLLLVGCVFGLSGAVLLLKRLQGDLKS